MASTVRRGPRSRTCLSRSAVRWATPWRSPRRCACWQEMSEGGCARSPSSSPRGRRGPWSDPAVGFEFLPVVGERLEAGQPVAVVHARDEDSAGEAGRRILGALTFAEEPVAPPPLVYGWHPGEAG